MRNDILAMFLAMLLAVLPSAPRSQEAPSWTGQWQTFWRDGGAIMDLVENNGTVTGIFEPGGGRIVGTLDGQILRGTWLENAVSGGIVFAMAPDGQTFSGRYDTGEFWNGVRIGSDAVHAPRFRSTATPRETLRTLVVAVNTVLFDGDAAALSYLHSIVIHEGTETNERVLNRRRNLLWDLIDLSTFQIYDAPPAAEGDVATFSIGPAGTDVVYALQFQRSENGEWRILVENEAKLLAATARFLDALGHRTVASAKAARRNSPRAAMRAFIEGAHRWEDDGREAALAMLDLSFIPPHLRVAEGSIRADYLKQIIDRTGYVIWQEIPDNPDRTVPYVFYRHAVGSIVIERTATTGQEPDGPWRFSAATLRTTPDLFAAVQTLPLAEGLVPTEPLTPFFTMRQRVLGLAPYLARRTVTLENWQWLALSVATLLVVVLSWVAGRAAWLVSGFAQRGAPSDEQHHENRSIEWAARIAVAGILLGQGFVLLGVVDTSLNVVHRALQILTVLGITWIGYRAIDAIGAAAYRRASSTTSYVDEMITSLATGMVKLAIIVVGIVVCADIVELPYEGVLAGLGVGGIALAFAARDTVTNMLGGVLLITDRPFRRGDLVETAGELAVIENVGLRSTRMRKLDDTVLILPNGHLSDKAIVNWGMRKRRQIIFDIGLLYSTPRDTLDAFVSDLRDLLVSQDSVDEKDCYVGLKNFGSSSIDIECRFFVLVFSYDAQIAARHAIVGEILDLAERHGVSFAFPTRTVHMLTAPDSGTP